MKPLPRYLANRVRRPLVTFVEAQNEYQRERLGLETVNGRLVVTEELGLPPPVPATDAAPPRRRKPKRRYHSRETASALVGIADRPGHRRCVTCGCPIIRFVNEPHRLSCVTCIDEGLGVAPVDIADLPGRFLDPSGSV